MRFLRIALAGALLALPIQPAAAGPPKSGGACPRCQEPCHATIEKSTQTKHCWEVESKPICIPRVTFPWQKRYASKGKDGCALPAKCGRVKYVKVLVKHEYECPVCKYKWTPDWLKGGSKSLGAPVSIDPDLDVPPQPSMEATLRSPLG